jgi:hypothetical protein
MSMLRHLLTTRLAPVLTAQAAGAAAQNGDGGSGSGITMTVSTVMGATSRMGRGGAPGRRTEFEGKDLVNRPGQV